jgi:hypothetical protein
MDKVKNNKILYRIIQGRLRFSRFDPVLYIHEPTPEIMEESFDIYDKAYEESYFKGLYIKKELKEVLFENEMWSPLDDTEAKKITPQIEDLKIEAFKNYISPKKLSGIKANIRFVERTQHKLQSKIRQLDHVSCEGTAEFARAIWTLSKTVKLADGTGYDLNKCSLYSVLSFYNDSSITASQFRSVARCEIFRGMWNLAKSGSSIFSDNVCNLTRDQAALCSFASMYDNVNESPERPSEKVIEDDDCLDGWFISQKRKQEGDKKRREVEAMLSNSKVANSQEVFLMADSVETAKNIHDMNTFHGKNTVDNRNSQIDREGSVKLTELSDVKQELTTQARQAAIQKVKGR